MKMSDQYFEVKKLCSSVIVLQEKISSIHPIYRNDPLNLYLILGKKSALLLDTGCDQHPLKPIVNKIIENRELIVLNSHAHWDHVLGNHQFEKIYIHKSETQFINKKYNLSFLQDSPLESIKKYRKYDFYIPPAKNIIGIADGFTFNLGGTNIKVIHMPGHSPGSVCLLKDQQAIFTTDVAYYGDIFLPSRDLFTPVLESLENLMNMCKNYDDIILYPSHSKTPCDINLVKHLYKEINKIDEKWGNKKSRSFFNAWEIKSAHFNFIIGK